MAWVYLTIAGLLEVVWAIGLKYTEGFTRLWPSVTTVAAMIASLYFLALAVRSLPIGTAYAVWTGLGAALTVTYAITFGGESSSALKVLFLAGIIACVIGLKLVHSREERVAAAVGAMPPPDEPPGS
jgi:quaternary ammonium compound-resistance protein SugE